LNFSFLFSFGQDVKLIRQYFEKKGEDQILLFHHFLPKSIWKLTISHTHLPNYWIQNIKLTVNVYFLNITGKSCLQLLKNISIINLTLLEYLRYLYIHKFIIVSSAWYRYLAKLWRTEEPAVVNYIVTTHPKFIIAYLHLTHSDFVITRRLLHMSEPIKDKSVAHTHVSSQFATVHRTTSMKNSALGNFWIQSATVCIHPEYEVLG
jgi:hypothetical protein